jgi:putative phosphoesterase
VILGVLSDTHGNRAYMERAARRLLDTHRADTLIHLGDNYDDAEALAAWAPAVRMVPGLWCKEYRSRAVPSVLVETFAGVTVACAHADHDLTAHLTGVRVAMHGHTHIARVEERGSVIWLNPGHLKAPMDRGERPSYAVLTLDDAGIRIALHEMTGGQRAAFAFPASAATQEPR